MQYRIVSPGRAFYLPAPALSQSNPSRGLGNLPFSLQVTPCDGDGPSWSTLSASFQASNRSSTGSGNSSDSERSSSSTSADYIKPNSTIR